MSKERKANLPYKADTHDIFDDPSLSHKRVVEALLDQHYSESWIARATGLTEAAVKKLAAVWREKKK